MSQIISQVALSNTFNEFRSTFNDSANVINSLNDGTGGISVGPLTAATYIRLATLTSGRVLFANTNGELADDSGLTFNAATNTLTSGNLAVSGTSTLTGAATLAGAVTHSSTTELTGNITVNTNKLTITASNGTIFGATANAYLSHVHANTRVHSGPAVAAWLTEAGSNEEKHTVVGVDTSNDAIDIAVVNQSPGTLAYSEFIAMNDRGNTDSGWVSMGVNSSNYNDPAFALTKKDDAYILFEAPAGSTGTGDLVIATGAAGTSRKIIFGAGGFSTGNTQMEIEPDTRVFINIPTNSSSTTTGALVVNGGVGMTGNLNVGGNVTITGAISLQGSGNTVSTSSLSVANSLLFLAANNNADILDFGVIGEYKYGATTKYGGIVRDATDGIFKLFANNSSNPANTVNFSGVGNLYAPLVVGSANVANTTASTSSTTGALTVGGGAGVAGDLFTGGAIKVESGTTSSSTSTGALIVTGGVGIGGTLNVGGNTAFTGSVTVTGPLRVQEMVEDVIDVSQSGNAVTLDYTTGNIFYDSGATFSANYTVNITNVPIVNGRATVITFMDTQGATGYRPTTLNVNGSAVTIKWVGGTAPTPTSSSGKVDIFTFTLIYRGSAFECFASSALNF